MTDHKKAAAKRSQRKRGMTKPAPETSAPHTDAPAVAAPEPAARTLAVIPLHVRWRDLDAFNHVNNSSYLTFLEESRLQWLRQVPGEWFGTHSMPVMAAVELRYRRPIEWPAEIDVLLSCERLGNSSMTLGNRIVDRNDHSCVYADGNVVMVWVDPASGASVPLPEAIRQICSL
ncbi:MAG TPA: thioesterase family protein [Rhodanobacteraceae bacterium]|nr:thioesterase family protein [Rhodanobacteraceae bacterium]